MLGDIGDIGDIGDKAAAVMRLVGGAPLRSTLDAADPGDWLALDGGVREVAWHWPGFCRSGNDPSRCPPTWVSSMSPGSPSPCATATGGSARRRCAMWPDTPVCCRWS
jgi:hypothetical protein